MSKWFSAASSFTAGIVAGLALYRCYVEVRDARQVRTQADSKEGEREPAPINDKQEEAGADRREFSIKGEGLERVAEDGATEGSGGAEGSAGKPPDEGSEVVSIAAPIPMPSQTSRDFKSMVKAQINRHLSPAMNGVNLLSAIVKKGTLEAKDEAAVEYVINVLKKAPTEDLNVPEALTERQPEGDSDGMHPEVADWIEANFTTKGAIKLGRPKNLKALTKTVIFAMRLKKSSLVDALPFYVEPEKQAGIRNVLLTADKWDFNIWQLKELTEGRVLQTLAWHILHCYGLVEHFQLDKATLKNWLEFVESRYTDTEYHSATHAADVLQGVHFFLTTAGAIKMLGKIEQLALILSAIVHDMGHDGYNNVYHKNSMSKRALQFNDQSIQENFHVSELFAETFAQDNLNIFKHFNREQMTEIRRLMILAVLTSDMSKHFATLESFRDLAAEKGQDAEAWSSDQAASDILCEFILHLADISNPARPFPFARKWAELVMMEFFKQGDAEASLGLPISPSCDRHTTVLPKTQIGFIKFIVLPSYQIMKEVLPAVGNTVLPTLEDNLKTWHEFEEN